MAAAAEADRLRAREQAQEARANLTKRAAEATRAVIARVTAAGIDPAELPFAQALERFAKAEELRVINRAMECASVEDQSTEARDDITKTAGTTTTERRHGQV
jgi:hypothetical protein